MSNDRYRFKLGDFECLAILETQAYPNKAEMIFPNVSHADLRIENIDPEVIPLDSICLAVNTGTDWVVLDTGVGFVRDDLMLAKILKEENIQPAHFIITHLDIDHYGGLLNPDKTPAFPDANVYICRDAWELFISDAYYEKYSYEYDRREHLSYIKEQVQLVECAGEILPGFSLIPLPGHRDYHMGIEIESKGEKLLFAADVVAHPLHIKHLDWYCGADTDHELARESRIKFAEVASASGCLVHVFHFEFPGLGHVIQDGDGWKWQPLEL